MHISVPELYDIYLKHPVVSTDSRLLPENCIFFALRGANFDGHQYVQKALESGAAKAVIDDPSFQFDDRCLLVPDVLKALQDLAQWHRRQFEIPLIGIGGSNGKTTTKELVSAVLSNHYACHFTKGNLNNHIGVPLTLLAMPADTEVAIIEMGTNQPGDVAQLCDIAQPTHGLITNIGKEHLEGFGNLEGVKKAEAELFDYLRRHGGAAFVNLSEKYLKSMSRGVAHRVHYNEAARPGSGSNGSIDVQLLAEMPFVKVAFTCDETRPPIEVNTRLYGRHNFNNIMTAIALGIYFKVPGDKIKSALENYIPSNNRSQLLQRGEATILLDAYNANPSSMRPALQSLAAMPAGRRIAILGDMRELGHESLAEHESLLRFANRLGLDQIVLVGPEFARTKGLKNKALRFNTTAEAKTRWFDLQDFGQSHILIKGSRGIGLEKLL